MSRLPRHERQYRSEPHWLAAEPSTAPMMVLTRPIDTLLFVCRYLPPLYIRDDLRVLLGALLIGLGVFAVVHGTVRGGRSRLDDLAVGLVAFGLSVALLTAMARAEIGVPASSRYMAFSSLYWVGLLAFGGSLAPVREWGVARWAIHGALLSGLEPAMTIQTVADEPFVQRADRATAAVLSIVAGTPGHARVPGKNRDMRGERGGGGARPRAARVWPIHRKGRTTVACYHRA